MFQSGSMSGCTSPF